MKRNLLLYLSLLLSKVIRVFLVIGLGLLVTVFIHWHLDADYYQAVQVALNNGSLYFIEGKTGGAKLTPYVTVNSSLAGDESIKRIYLNDLQPFSRYFTFLQLVLSIVLGCFIVGEVIRILKSVQAFEPFNATNVKSFRRIGYFLVAMLVLNSFHFLSTNTTSSISFSINYTLLIFMLIAFILAEIFSEGEKLYEQEKLTI